MKYHAYTEYKSSGVGWIGEIPASWDMWKVKHFSYYIGSGTTPDTGVDENYGGDTLWVTTGELRENVITDTHKKVSSSALIKYSSLRLHPAGAVAIAMYGATIGRLGILGREATTNQACCVFPPSKIIHNKYLLYWLLGVRKEIINLASGGGQPNINQEKLASLRVSAPEYHEQTQIAFFLDRETAKIDRLIEKQQRLIDLLEEKRQAVISHAVTKGLNPDAPMKYSGVEWLGAVPKHWDVKRLSYVALLKSGDGITSEQINNDSMFPVYGGNGLRGYYDEYNHDGNYALIGRQGALCGNVNIAEGKFWASEHAIVVYPLTHWDTHWLSFVLHAMNLNQYSVSAAQPGLAVANITCLKVPFPSDYEQVEIAKYIQTQSQKLNRLKEKSEHSIKLLRERRTALISAAVTGKIDVRDQVPQDVGEAVAS